MAKTTLTVIVTLTLVILFLTFPPIVIGYIPIFVALYRRHNRNVAHQQQMAEWSKPRG